jgi:hypothetical protein
MSNEKTYEILCSRGLNRVECSYKKRDPDLNCALCSFARYKERSKQHNEPRQPDIQ